MCIDGKDHDWVFFTITLPDGGQAPAMRCTKCQAEVYA